MINSSSVVVTGASGLLGKSIIRVCSKLGIAVTPVSRRAAPGSVQVTSYRSTPEGDILIHLAEENNIGRANQAGEDYEVETVETLKVLASRNYKRIIYTSSGWLYGDTQLKPHSVGDNIVVNDTYSRVKSACEQIVLSSGKNVVVRLANLYGPGMSKESLLSTILGQLSGSEAIRIRDDKPVRDFLWVDDAAEAIVKIALGDSLGIFNVGSGVGVSVRELARTVSEVAGKDEREIVAYGPSSKNSNLVLDIKATSEILGWVPKTSLRSGLDQILRWEKKDE